MCSLTLPKQVSRPLAADPTATEVPGHDEINAQSVVFDPCVPWWQLDEWESPCTSLGKNQFVQSGGLSAEFQCKGKVAWCHQSVSWHGRAGARGRCAEGWHTEGAPPA